MVGWTTFWTANIATFFLLSKSLFQKNGQMVNFWELQIYNHILLPFLVKLARPSRSLGCNMY